jgi:hypothetical protein
MAVASVKALPHPPLSSQPFCSTKNFVYDYFDVHNVRLYLGLVGHNRLVVHDTKAKYKKYTIFLKIKNIPCFKSFTNLYYVVKWHWRSHPCCQPLWREGLWCQWLWRPTPPWPPTAMAAWPCGTSGPLSSSPHNSLHT